MQRAVIEIREIALFYIQTDAGYLTQANWGGVKPHLRLTYITFLFCAVEQCVS